MAKKNMIDDIEIVDHRDVPFYNMSKLYKSNFKKVVQRLTDLGSSLGDYDVILGLEAMGFPVAGGMCSITDKGLAIARKEGKLPGDLISVSYNTEYSTDNKLFVEAGSLEGLRVMIVDNVVATGGTLRAAAELVRVAGGTVVGCVCIVACIEFEKKWPNITVKSLYTSEDIQGSSSGGESPPSTDNSSTKEEDVQPVKRAKLIEE